MSSNYRPEELAEAIRAFKSSIGKCEKAQIKLKENSPQRKWVNRQLEAYYIAVSLIEKMADDEKRVDKLYTEPELSNAAKTIEQLIVRCEMLPTKFKNGSPQNTLALRRLSAFRLAAALIKGEMAEYAG